MQRRKLRSVGLSAAGPAVGLIAIAAIVGTRWDELAAALGAASALAVAAAIALHAATLVLRAEAWRMALNAIGARLARRAVHGASAGAFAAGTAVSHATMPVRLLLLRRAAPESGLRKRSVVVADAPIALLEALCALAVIALAAALSDARGPLPGWLGPVGLIAVAGLLLGLRVVHRRLGEEDRCERPLVAGLAVLACPRRRGALLGFVAGLTTLTVLRVWVVLLALGLPHGFADAAAVFGAMTVVGLLPVGPAAGPAATLAVLGGGDLAVAAAAGLLISGSSVAGVATYAGGVGLASPLGRRRRVRRVLQPLPHGST